MVIFLNVDRSKCRCLMTPAAITHDERRPVQAGSFSSQRRSMCCSKVASIVGDTETAGPFVFRVRVGVGTLTCERGQSREPCLDNHLRAFHDLMGAEVLSWSRWSMSMACGGKDRPRCLIESRSSAKVAMALEIVTASACVTCFWANRSHDRSHDAMISGLRCPEGFNAPASVHTWHKALTRLCTASGASA